MSSQFLFFLTLISFKSFSNSWVELDSGWFGSDWYYQNDIEYNYNSSIGFWLQESFDKDQKTKNYEGKVIIYDTIFSFHQVWCSNKRVRTTEIILSHNGYEVSRAWGLAWERVLGDNPYPYDDIDISWTPTGSDNIEWSSLLKSPLKKMCKIYDQSF